jgi:menaquinol-cytochrome c reductase iron-sulfur subunit
MSGGREGRSEGAPASEGPATEDRSSGCEGCVEPSPERRRFLAAFALGAGALASAALLVPWTGLFLAPVRRSDPETWRVVGETGDFPVGRTTKVVYRDFNPLPWAGFAGRSAAWVRRDADERFSAFTTYCTHVGCTVRWEEEARLFLCPCHGGAFYADGTVAAGPPPRPLDRYPIRIRDGRVEIQVMPIPEPSG